MAKKYSKAQEVYMLAKAHLEVLETQEKVADHQYIIDNGIKNPDGSIPEQIYCIEDDEIFEKANEEFGKVLDKTGLWNEILEARKLLKEAEQNLIDWGLLKVKKDLPPGIYTTLLKGMKQYEIRQKLIELTLRVEM